MYEISENNSKPVQLVLQSQPETSPKNERTNERLSYPRLCLPTSTSTTPNNKLKHSSYLNYYISTRISFQQMKIEFTYNTPCKNLIMKLIDLLNLSRKAPRACFRKSFINLFIIQNRVSYKIQPFSSPFFANKKKKRQTFLHFIFYIFNDVASLQRDKLYKQG